MIVRVRDHETEKRVWGYGPEVVIRTITIPDRCPKCGGPRGEVKPYRFFCDGDWFSVDTWDNPCGHIDFYADVIADHTTA
jgi:hypothetical protein